jgi:hypothetical protein
MNIKEIIDQNRRDFQAIYECEHCGSTIHGPGYDDEYFHKEVIPSMICINCGKTASDEYIPKEPKYPDGYQV